MRANPWRSFVVTAVVAVLGLAAFSGESSALERKLVILDDDLDCGGINAGKALRRDPSQGRWDVVITFDIHSAAPSTEYDVALHCFTGPACRDSCGETVLGTIATDATGAVAVTVKLRGDPFAGKPFYVDMCEGPSGPCLWTGLFSPFPAPEAGSGPFEGLLDPVQ